MRLQTKKGTPQGGVLSPLLANIYLNEFDQFWFNHWGKDTESQRQRYRKQGKASCVLFRYADDFILSVKGTREQAAGIMDSIRGFFAEGLRLTLSTEKTRVVPLTDGFDFLGFRIQRAQLGYGVCVRIRPTQRNLIRLKGKMQAMLGRRAWNDDPQMKIAAMNRVLRGWANYYKTVNSYRQFKAGDFYAERLFRAWYRRKSHISVTEYLSKVCVHGKVVVRRGDVAVELYRMTSNRSMHTVKNYRRAWKYRSISNPYINGGYSTGIPEEDNPVIDVPDIRWLTPEYNDETYLTNRLLAFERDGWKCTKCGSQENLQAHHIEPVPIGTFDPIVVHRVGNLQALCADCHKRLPRTDLSAS
jgi:RNA-directed DNA polymerase